MAVAYKAVGRKFGGGPGNSNAVPAATPWKISTVYAAGAQVVSGGFAFSTVAGGTSASSGSGPNPLALTDNTVTWVLIGPVLPLYGSEAAQTAELGVEEEGVDPTYGVGRFVYAKFTGSTAVKAGDWVVIDRASKTATLLSTSSAVGRVGIAMGPHALDVATPTYGWVMVDGIHDGANVATGVAAHGLLGATSTAGRAGASATGERIDKAFERLITSAGNVGTVEINDPLILGNG